MHTRRNLPKQIISEKDIENLFALYNRAITPSYKKYLFVCRNFTRIVKVKPRELMRALNEINPDRIEILA